MPHHKPLVPDSFAVPVRIAADRFLVRPLGYADAERDYEAWQSSTDHLRGIFGPASDWPDASMTLQDNAIDLAWHQREHEQRGSFAYTIVDPTDVSCLGCVYINPSRKQGFDAEVFYWVRASEAQTGLDDDLGSFVRRWVKNDWPFSTVVYPGRDVSWDEFQALANREHW